MKLYKILNIILIAVILILPAFSYSEDEARKQDSTDSDTNITEILIKGAPLQVPLKDFSGSASIIGEKQIESQGSDHFQNLIDQVPNLNWAGGTSRPRFFQIRGIGELEQYEGAPNPSVGVLIDDIDLSGIGTPATLFDIDQVEVLRGPQSIRYGSNALAGIIHLHSSEPTSYTTGKAELGTGSDEMYEGGAAAGGAVAGTDEKLLFRFSAYHHYNDGFRDNPYLSRDDTNKREESTFRGKFSWRPNSDFKADVSLLAVNINNGYDAFSIDNTFTTYSDQPGRDNQDTKGLAIKLSQNLSNSILIESLSTKSKSDMQYSFDGDWGNNDYWQPYSPYDYFSETFRDRDVYSQEFRLRSRDEEYEHGINSKWLSGVYFQRLDEDTDLSNYQDKVVYDRLISDYKAKTIAAFAQYEQPIVKGMSLSLGLRAENRKMEYEDSDQADFNPSDDMYGGNISLNHDLTDNIRTYLLVSRGFKGGGFNQNPAAPVDRREYSPEYLWNYEAGIKSNLFDNRLQLNVSAFYADREDVQVKLASQNDPSDPLSFLFLTDNAAGGKNYGLESEAVLKATEKLKFSASGALLNTEFDDFNYSNQELSGRDQSHAPNWQYSIGPDYSFTDNLFAAANISGKDAFFYDDSHPEKSSPYHLVNISTGFRSQTWSWVFWVRNLFDKEYAVRGFYFGNEPPDFTNKEYVQLGDPRRIGTTFTYHF